MISFDTALPDHGTVGQGSSHRPHPSGSSSAPTASNSDPHPGTGIRDRMRRTAGIDRTADPRLLAPWRAQCFPRSTHPISATLHQAESRGAQPTTGPPRSRPADAARRVSPGAPSRSIANHAPGSPRRQTAFAVHRIDIARDRQPGNVSMPAGCPSFNRSSSVRGGLLSVGSATRRLLGRSWIVLVKGMASEGALVAVTAPISVSASGRSLWNNSASRYLPITGLELPAALAAFPARNRSALLAE